VRSEKLSRYYSNNDENPDSPNPSHNETVASADMRNAEHEGYTGETLEENKAEKATDEQLTDENSSPIAGRISGSMEQLERMQGAEASISGEVRECLKDSLDCYQTCTETTIKCLTLGGKHAEPQHLNPLIDCARICNTNADFILRNSTYYPQTCGLTADICDECADMCDRFEEDFMKDCASACRRCSESCREMAR
jgi:hypothetical protein